ncbi:MAG: DUF6079 family protein [Pseudomonadota bacterium]
MDPSLNGAARIIVDGRSSIAITEMTGEMTVGAYQNVFRDADYILAVEQAAVRYYKTALVVGSSGSGKTKLLKQICGQMQIPLINLGIEPIESVIQLRDANRKESACKLVASYVISNEMCQRLSEVVIPHLQYEKPHDNKGILIVGNYGTGKSYMLSVLSTVAEDADVLSLLSNPIVRDTAAGIAGKFKVIRLEIGATQMALQDIITTALEKNLADWGVSFRFSDATQQYENKTSFENMMDAFHQKFPDLGLLIVVDEMLDYLRSRHDQPLILDLGFLREVGEVCKDLRFRFGSAT